MTAKERLELNITTLRESVNNDWKDLASLNLTSDDRKDIRKHIAICVSEMAALLAQLEKKDA